MSAKTRILATAAGFVTYFMLGWILYGMLFMGFFESNMGSASGVSRGDDIVWWSLVLGNITMTYLLVYIFGSWANITTFGGGLKAGLMIGLIIGLGFNLNMYGTTNIMNLTGTLVDPIVSAVMMGITGGVVGMMIGRGS